MCLDINTEPLAADETPLSPMHALSAADQNHILALLDAGHTAIKIAATTQYSLDAVSKLCSKHHPHLSKSLGHAQHLISSGKADTVVDVAKVLRNVINQSLSCKLCVIASKQLA